MLVPAAVAVTSYKAPADTGTDSQQLASLPSTTERACSPAGGVMNSKAILSAYLRAGRPHPLASDRAQHARIALKVAAHVDRKDKQDSGPSPERRVKLILIVPLCISPGEQHT